MQESILDLAKQLGWKYRVSGQGELNSPCPFPSCDSQEDKFYVEVKTGKWCCFKCNEKGGSLKSLKFKLGLVQLQEPVKENIVIPDHIIEGYQTSLLNTDDALDYLTRIRGFNEETIKQFHLGYTEKDHQRSIVIPIYDTKKRCVGCKYYFYKSEEGPKIKYEKGSRKQFFNLQVIDFTKPILITEGEWDCMSAWQAGYRNTGSIPNGAKSISEEWVNEISHGTEYLLCFDNDIDGEAGANSLANLIGVSKCKRVHPRLKDFNDYLQYGIEEKIHECIDSAESMYVPPNTSVSTYVERAIREIDDPVAERGCPTGWTELDRVLGGIRNGELTILTGKTGNGKSTWGYALQSNLLKSNWGWKILTVSGEDKGSKVIRKLVSSFYNKKATPEDLIEFERSYSNEVHILNPFNQWESKDLQMGTDKLFDTIEFYVGQGFNFFFIDHAHIFIHEGENEIEEVHKFVQRARKVVLNHPIHILLVVQPTKLPPKVDRVKMQHLRGSVIWEQSCWNCITVHRVNEDDHLVRFEIEKNREWGRLGEFALQFDMETQANYHEYEDITV